MFEQIAQFFRFLPLIGVIFMGGATFSETQAQMACGCACEIVYGYDDTHTCKDATNPKDCQDCCSNNAVDFRGVSRCTNIKK